MGKNYGLGVDFGGTKLLASVVDLDSGKVLSSSKKKTDPTDSPDELMDRLYSAIDEALDEADLSKKHAVGGMGVGIAGQVDSDKGILLAAPNLSSATVNLPIAAMLQDRYDIPTFLLNDVQIAALGEATFGAGRKTDDFLCVFVGTGVGGAIVHSRTLVRGTSGSAGEIGHLVVDANGRLCGCGGRGHLEAYASRTAITTSIVGELRRGRKSKLTKLLPELETADETSVTVRSGVLAKAVDDKDDLAIEVVDEAAFYLGIGLASAINLLNPPLIVLGGGAIESIDRLFKVASDRAIRESLPTAAKAVEIVKAKLGDDAGVVGAAIHAQREIAATE